MEIKKKDHVHLRRRIVELIKDGKKPIQIQKILKLDRVYVNNQMQFIRSQGVVIPDLRRVHTATALANIRTRGLK